MLEKIKFAKMNKEDTNDIEQVAKILYSWWGKDCNLKFEDLIEIAKDRCGNFIPITYVAKLENEIIGTVSFLENDASLRPDIFPMIGGMYVKSEFRNNGIASKLLVTLMEDISKNFKQVYLTTPLEDFYEKFGFKFIEMIETNIVNGRTIEERLYKKEF